MIEKAIAFATQAHEGYPECGEELWNRFRMKDKNVIGWKEFWRVNDEKNNF